MKTFEQFKEAIEPKQFGRKGTQRFKGAQGSTPPAHDQKKVFHPGAGLRPQQPKTEWDTMRESRDAFGFEAKPEAHVDSHLRAHGYDYGHSHATHDYGSIDHPSQLARAKMKRVLQTHFYHREVGTEAEAQTPDTKIHPHMLEQGYGHRKSEFRGVVWHTYHKGDHSYHTTSQHQPLIGHPNRRWKG